ncbi:21988_t:CDS:2 [Cetraspora pellucida]|uniref:21988_t:CDS:1 n=1 Tax=Cetraspora pellucida TaxID=1433469 RepID=A0A9N9A7R8_9GLOM|nr:21988_t:CDS:2 [Cetraspora pellucida]
MYYYFFDDIDALCPKSDEACNELGSVLMDGISNKKNVGLQDKIAVIGATNRPNALDEAVRGLIMK